MSKVSDENSSNRSAEAGLPFETLLKRLKNQDWVALIVQTFCILGVVFFVIEVVGFFVDLDPEENWSIILPAMVFAVVVSVIITRFMPIDIQYRELVDAMEKVPNIKVFISFQSDKNNEVKKIKNKLIEGAPDCQLQFLSSPESMNPADLIVVIFSGPYDESNTHFNTEYNLAKDLVAAEGKEIIRIVMNRDIEGQIPREFTRSVIVKGREVKVTIESQVESYHNDPHSLHESQRKLKVLAAKKHCRLKECFHDVYLSAPKAAMDMIATMREFMRRDIQEPHVPHEPHDEPYTPREPHEPYDEPHAPLAPLASHTSGLDVMKFDRITEFWNTKSKLDEKIIQITGTVSTYAPVVWGPPMMKRDAHLNFRTSKGAINESSLNNLLALSAGQTLWALNVPLKESAAKTRFLGIYQGIVRNSIPMFVDSQYFDKVVYGMFTDRSKSKTFEGKVTGKVISLPSTASALSRMESWAAGWESDKRIAICERDMPVYGIYVGYDNDQTSIEKVGETKYLDGDIWVTVEKDGEESMISRFGDLSNENDVEKMLKQMKDEAKEHEVIFQFDQLDKPFEECRYSENQFCQKYMSD